MDKAVKLVSRGSVINGATPSSLEAVGFQLIKNTIYKYLELKKQTDKIKRRDSTLHKNVF